MQGKRCGNVTRRNRKLNAFLTIVAVIFTRRLQVSFPLAIALCKKGTMSGDGRQEIKYNATKKSRTRRSSLGATALRLIRVNSQQSYEVQGSTRFSTPVTRKGDGGADARRKRFCCEK